MSPPSNQSVTYRLAMLLPARNVRGQKRRAERAAEWTAAHLRRQMGFSLAVGANAGLFFLLYLLLLTGTTTVDSGEMCATLGGFVLHADVSPQAPSNNIDQVPVGMDQFIIQSTAQTVDQDTVGAPVADPLAFDVKAAQMTASDLAGALPSALHLAGADGTKITKKEKLRPEPKEVRRALEVPKVADVAQTVPNSRSAKALGNTDKTWATAPGRDTLENHNIVLLWDTEMRAARGKSLSPQVLKLLNILRSQNNVIGEMAFGADAVSDAPTSFSNANDAIVAACSRYGGQRLLIVVVSNFSEHSANAGDVSSLTNALLKAKARLYYVSTSGNPGAAARVAAIQSGGGLRRIQTKLFAANADGGLGPGWSWLNTHLAYEDLSRSGSLVSRK